MNDHDLDPFEVELRARLQRTLVPPTTPTRLRVQVEQMAAEALAAEARPRRTWREAIGMGGSAIRFAAGTLAVVAVVVLAVVVLNSRVSPTPVAASPHPTLPAFKGPTLPPAPASPTRIEQGTWIDATTAYVIPAGSDSIRMTTDGGLTWSEPRPLPAPTDLGLDFVDADHGYTMWSTHTDNPPSDQLTAYRTTDGGRTWQSAPIGSVTYGAGEDLFASIHYADRLHGVAIATSEFQPTTPAGEVTGPYEPKASWGFATDDGGATWTPLATPLLVSGVQWANPRVGLGESLPGNTATVSTTVDGGRTWKSGALPGVDGGAVDFQRLAIVAADAGELRLIGYRLNGSVADLRLVVLASADSGATWTETYSSTAPGAGSLTMIEPLGQDHWLGFTGFGDHDWTLLLETWDGGRSWQVVALPAISIATMSSWGDRLHGMVQGVDMIGCLRSNECGGSGTMFLTNDGGRTWHEVPF